MMILMKTILNLVSDCVRISKYKNIYAKRYTPNWPKEIVVISKIKNSVL